MQMATQKVHKRGMPDGPSSPWWWQTFRFVTNPFYHLHKCAERYGDVFSGKLFVPIVVFSNPQGIQEIFTGDAKDLFAGAANVPLLPVLGSDSLLLLDIDPHMRMRRLLLPPFHGKRMRLYGETIREITHKVLHLCPKNSALPIHPQMQTISIEVILRAVFGLEDGPRCEKFKKTLISYLDIFTGSATFLLYVPPLQRDLGPFTVWRRYLKKLREVDELIYSEIERRRTQESDQEDIFSLLLAIRDEDGQPLSDKELRDQLLTLSLAGHETTAAGLAWSFYWILRTPGVLEKLLRELPKEQDFDLDAVTHLEYLDAVCKETLRLHPVVPAVGRILQRPMEIMGYQLDKGVLVSPSIFLTHNNKDIYPQPDLFRPERFLERRYSPYEYLPFGGGVRRCIGEAFAKYEMKIVLATALSQLRFQLVNSKPVAIKRKGPTLFPADGVPVTITSCED